MKNKAVISLIPVFLFSASALAEVTMKVPPEVSVVVANGHTPKLTGSVFDSAKTLHLPDGTQQILFRYKPYFAQGKDNIGVESDVLVSSFQVSNQNLEFVLPEYSDLKEAQANIHTMDWSFATEDGQKVASINDKLVKDGIQFGRNYITEAALYNQGNNAASVHTFAPEMTLSDRQIHSTSQPQTQSMQNADYQYQQAPTGGPSVESMLHYWYNQADPSTKAKFRAFVNGQ
ncbi:DUF2057 family protein [Vibrio viridaestus]|uniref:DUF2057 family protein n=1 Tax=Vibrio viridaestus TaxID=2487322 RepID=UPI00140E90F8|nr:DUF2057 family protein [Vibrio viridaestus]